jgi:hypothetical protein
MATASTNFYVTGGTLQGDAPSYVTRQADADLFEGLRAGQFCYVLTSRQMGKSSLMVRTAARLREEAGANVAVLDLTAIGQNLTAEQWYDGLLGRVGRQLDLEDELEDFWLDHERLGPLERWTRAIREVVLAKTKGPVVIFVDEIDAVRSLPFSTDEFFAALRELYNRRTEDAELNRLSFCLLGVAAPSDLIRDARMTPFNIGQRVELSDFTAAEAAPLAAGLPGGEKLLNRILYWTNGHPYLTQRLCRAVAEDEAATNASGVDRQCEELFLSSRSRESDDNLLFVSRRLLSSDADVREPRPDAERAALLDLYAQIHAGRRVADDDTNPLITLLRLSGLAAVRDNRLRVRNRIYQTVFGKQWITANMPDAELRRQRAAYRAGVLRAAAIAAVILLLVGSLAAVAFQQRNRAQAEARRADEKTKELEQKARELEMALADAKSQRQRAEDKQQEADEQRADAQEQKELAEQKNREAQAQKHAADEQRAVAVKQTEIAQQQTRRATEQTTIAQSQKQEAIRQRTRAEEKTREAEESAHANRRLLYNANMYLAGQAWESRNIGRVDELLQSQLPPPGAEDLRGFEWHYLNRMANGLLTLRGHASSVWAVAVSPDGRRIITGSADTTAKVWDARTGVEVLADESRAAGREP